TTAPLCAQVPPSVPPKSRSRSRPICRRACWASSAAAHSVSNELPLLYTEYADWFHLLTAPADYAEDARLYLDLLADANGSPPRTVLELGSGGGNNASHYKHAV